MSNQVSVVLNGLIYLSFFKISFQWVSIVSDVSSTVYFRFRNYRITDVVFIFDNIVSFSFPMKKCESESGEAFRRSFPTVFIPRYSLCFKIQDISRSGQSQIYSALIINILMIININTYILYIMIIVFIIKLAILFYLINIYKLFIVYS